MDFQELKNKVDKERERRLSEGQARGDVMPQSSAPKDSLLHELQMSLRTGQPSKMVENMRQVDRVANTKAGASGKPPQVGGGSLNDALSQHISAPPKNNNYPPQQQHPQQPRQQMNEQVNPRDSAFDQQFQQRPRSQGSLSEQLGQIGGNYQNPQQQMMEAYQQMGCTNQPMQQQQYAPQQQQNQNPNQINEQVNQALQNVDFGSLLQESLKNTVMEMYAMEKIQKSLLENKDVIKKIVKETLIELSQSKKKSTN